MRRLAVLLFSIVMASGCAPIEMPALEGEEVAVRIEPADGEPLEFRCSSSSDRQWGAITLEADSDVEILGVGCATGEDDVEPGVTTYAQAELYAARSIDQGWRLGTFVSQNDLEPGAASLRADTVEVVFFGEPAASGGSLSVDQDQATGRAWAEWESGAVAIRFDVPVERFD